MPPRFPLDPRQKVVLVALLALILVLLVLSRQSVAHAASPRNSPRAGWQWPTSPAAVLRGYVAPATEYGRGHRGLDLRAAVGDQVRALADGHVSFVGAVAETMIVSITHPGGWTSTYLPVISGVALNQSVRGGEVIGTLAPDTSHCTCLHLGLRYFGGYVSPMLVLGEVPRAVLLPW